MKTAGRTKSTGAKAREPQRAQLIQIPMSNRGRGELLIPLTDRRPLSSLMLDDLSLGTVKEVLEQWTRRQELAGGGIEPPRVVAVIGPPGWGKTCLASAVATELELPLYRVSHGAVIASYMGDTAANLEAIMRAVAGTETVLLLDEFDSLAAERGSGDNSGSRNEERRICNSILQLIDTLTPGVLLILATNLPERIDRALWRRVDHAITLGPREPDCDDWSEKFLPLSIEVLMRTFTPGGSEDGLDGAYRYIERVTMALRALRASPAEAERFGSWLKSWAWLRQSYTEDELVERVDACWDRLSRLRQICRGN